MSETETFHQTLEPPPPTPVEPVTEILHGVTVTDPYRWLEDQDSPRTRRWIEQQTWYARAYLDNIPGRDRIRKRIQELLSIETYDSLRKVGNCYFFRKRTAQQQQPCIYMRHGVDGEDELLVDPAARDIGSHVAAHILSISLDGKLLAYAIVQGGERSIAVEILDIDKRKKLPDGLPRGFLWGFAFAPDNKSFYYVHHEFGAQQSLYWAAYQHILSSDLQEDREIFFAGEDPKIQLGIVADKSRLGFIVRRFEKKKTSDFYLQSFGSGTPPQLVLRGVEGMFTPILCANRIFAITEHNAPNRQIIEILPNGTTELFVPEAKARIASVARTSERVFVSYLENFRTHVGIYDLSGSHKGDLFFKQDETIHIPWNQVGSNELLYESESFMQPPAIYRYLPDTNQHILWFQGALSCDASNYASERVWYSSKDGTKIPMLLVGRRDFLNSKVRPTILTGYGGFGSSRTPRFSNFVRFLLERGCILAHANLRGGSEFGAEWHLSAKRHGRQKAFDDFFCAAEWLIENEYATTEKLAIVGGSNSGLLVGVALTQRPDLFRAVVCIGPLLDMLRYHLFDVAHMWKDEYGSCENADDFSTLHAYSPYHQVRPGVAYPAMLIVSGDADQQCNPLHARKMIARLQTANGSQNPILLDYTKFRGHTPVLPLSMRIEALTDRLAFICVQLGIPV